MGDSEDYFPRGGKKPTASHFKPSGNFLGAVEKGEKRKKKKQTKKVDGDDGYLSDDGVKEFDTAFRNCSVGISYKTAKEGLLLLARIKCALEAKLDVMLPSKMTGSVMACHVSEPYNKLLEAYVNDQIDKVPSLRDMFRSGQYVAVKILEAKDHSLMLSMMPQHINSAMNSNDLHNGTLLQAAVSSVEDHGYVMDIGIPNTTAFLPKKNVNPEINLDTGFITWCCVKTVSSAAKPIVTLSNDLTAIQNAVQRRKTTSILPATAVEFIVEKPLDNGIEGRIFGDTTAYVQRQHADSVKGKKPGLGQKIRARVLYVMPTRNTPFLTMKNIFEATYPDLEEEQKFKEGDIIDNAQVIKIIKKSIHFKLCKGSTGLMSVKRIQVNEDLTDEEVVSKFYPIGSTHRVRVLCYNLLDFTYSVTDQSDILNEKYFNLEQLEVGDIVEGTVKSIADKHIMLNVGRVTGLVPHAHLSDAGVFIDPKKATPCKLTKKYKVGQEVKARVLSVDLHKRNLFLTLKPSLLSTEIELLKSYEQAEVGKAYTGTIKFIRDFVLVSFFGDVIAFVPRHYVCKEPIENLTDSFHIGQIVTCTIIRVDIEAKKMTGSFTTPPFDPSKRKNKPEKRKQTDIEDNLPNKKHKSTNEQTANIKLKDKKKKDKLDELDNNEEQEMQIKKTQDSDVEYVDKKNKNKKKKLQDSTDCVENKEQKFKKSKEMESSEINNEVKTKKKENDHVEPEQISEESDPIETDIHESSEDILTPQEIGLLDLSDCNTAKKFKKRIKSILKAISGRVRRIENIEKKIWRIENRGLNAENKKFHTAMHMEKIVIEERIKKLVEGIKEAEKKLKEFNVEDEVDYKELQKEKKKLAKNNKKAKVEVKVDTNEQNESKVDRKKIAENIKVIESLKPALEIPSAKEFWSANNENFTRTVNEESSSSNEDEELEQPKKKRKKLTVAEKVAKAREEEERIREMERRAIESESSPQSSEQFERALLANPDCSQLWIAYMAFYLQATEIDKARAVGRKALTTISFREEQEKLNVWLAMLNFENRFGTKESLQKTLEEALQMNDTFKIHSKLLDIYVETSKQPELVALVDLMLRKYKRDPQTYILCGGACFKLGLVDKARQVMQKAISVLEKKEHVAVLVQFALLERAHGERERAEALFEQVVAVYPQRVDVCSVYVDMLLKSGDVERVRQVMDRLTSQKLPARKMKVLYKKWIEVEEKLGDDEKVESLRQRAMEYINKAKF